MKVCIACRNTLTNDRRTVTEAQILAKAGMEVVVIGLRGKGQDPYESCNGFHIRRVRAILDLAPAFRDRLYHPVYHRLSRRGQWIARYFYWMITPRLRWLSRRLKRLTIYARLGRAMFSEKADYYHAHSPLPLMTLTFLIATLLRRRFVRDHNEILVLTRSEKMVKGYYEQGLLWERSLNDRESERIEATIRLIPPDITSILDVGCGDGRIANRLVRSFPRVVGIDVAQEALQNVLTDVIYGSVEHLPFKDRSFDLVLVTELLEHVPESVCRKALHQIRRVARRWILIGVPWREQLSVAQARCGRCKTIFHVNYHHRSFDERQLRTLGKPDFGLVTMEMTGGERVTYAPALLWIKRHIGGIWARTPTSVCPTCQTHLSPGGFPERNSVSEFCDRQNKTRAHRKMPEKSHVLCLYQRVAGQVGPLT